MGRGRLRIVALGLALGLSACEKPAPPPQRVAPPPLLSERVRVIDGDAISVDGKSVRLVNAYAPQPVPYARCWAEALAYRAAVSQLKAMIADGRAIDVKPTGGVDEFNRPFAQVSLDGSDLGESLRRLGVAASRPPATFRWCAGFSEATDGAPTLQSVMARPR
jgi:endonuclease YncB( thermonuclease family)